MAILPILTYPHPALRKKAAPVTEINGEVAELIENMIDTLYAARLPGLAANQIGVSKRIIVYDLHQKAGERNYTVLINPRIVFQEGEVLSENEGCRSLCGLRMDVKRAVKIQAAGLDQAGKPLVINATGLEAIIIQHKIDHLNGMLVIDRASPGEQALYQRYATNLAAIFKRIAWLHEKPNGIIYQQKTSDQITLIIKDGTQIQLYFASPQSDDTGPQLSGIMSRIDLTDPLMLLGVYTQAMMLTLAWNQDPKRVYILGFGGGRIPMIFHHYFPQTVIEGSEIDPSVVEIAKRYFGIETNPYLQVATSDGRKHLAGLSGDVRYDIILIDCYSEAGYHPYRLATVEFYELCKSRLANGGVVATNLIETDPLYHRKAQTFINGFTYVYDFTYEKTHVFFGSDTGLTEHEFLSRITAVQQRCRFHFPFLERARAIKLLKPLLPGIDSGCCELLTDAAPPPDTFKWMIKKDPVFNGVGRNEPCPCGSGKKFKKCHGLQSR